MSQTSNVSNDSVSICGFQVSTLSSPSFFDRLKPHAGSECHWVVTLNLEMISRVRRDPTYRSLLQKANTFTADGMPVSFASSMKARRWLKNRITGIEISRHILTSPFYSRVLLIGGMNPAAALAALSSPGADQKFKILDGKFDLSAECLARVIEAVHVHRPDAVLLALGVPKQDRLAEVICRNCKGAVVVGVGGSLDILAGLKPRAPRWMQVVCLEWLFRLMLEPNRLWRRYLLEYPPGAIALLRDVLRSLIRN